MPHNNGIIVLERQNVDIFGQASTEYDISEQEAQLMLAAGVTRLAVSRGQQTQYHSIY